MGTLGRFVLNSLVVWNDKAYRCAGRITRHVCQRPTTANADQADADLEDADADLPEVITARHRLAG